MQRAALLACLSPRSDKTCRSDETRRQCIKFDTFCHLTLVKKRAVVTKRAATPLSSQITILLSCFDGFSDIYIYSG